MLVIDACVRGDISATRRYYQAFLEKYHPDQCEVVDLSELKLMPVNLDYLKVRDGLRYEGRFDDPLFDLARQFRDADEILIAAPYWDLSFPAILKIYLEHVSVCDLTFGYDELGNSVGYCKAKRLLYFSSCGGYIGDVHLGYEYVKAFAEMLGIEHCEAYTLERLDIDPSQRESILNDAVVRL